MFTLFFVAFFVFVFHLNFIFSFILNPSCIIPLLISSFLSFLPLDWFVYLWQKGGGYTGEYTDVYHHVFMTHVHILWGRNSTSCTFVRGESHRRDAYTKEEKTSCMRKPCFNSCMFSRCFMVLWVMFSIYALLLSSHRVYVLDMYTSLCYYALLVACSNDHLLCYMIIVVIFIWLSCVWSSCLYVSHHVYLIICLFVILYLSFYHLIYLESFCASVSGYRYTCFKFIIASRIRCEWVFPLFPNSL